jgi:hypothetical protein
MAVETGQLRFGAIAAVPGDLAAARRCARIAYELGLNTGEPMGDHALANVARLDVVLRNARSAVDSLEVVVEERGRRGDVVVSDRERPRGSSGSDRRRGRREAAPG